MGFERLLSLDEPKPNNKKNCKAKKIFIPIPAGSNAVIKLALSPTLIWL
jgi:hypothetical protein